MDSVLSIRDVSIQIRNQQLLQNISFDIGEGEVVLLSGANGIGKSSLLKSILRLDNEGKTINQGEEFKSDLNQAESSVFAEWFYSKGKFSYSLGLRLNRLHFSNVSVTKSYYHFLPKAMVGYRFSDNSFIRYDAEMSQTNPTLMELADTEIRLDSYLAEKGNLLLQPYLNLNNNLYPKIRNYHPIHD